VKILPHPNPPLAKGRAGVGFTTQMKTLYVENQT